MTGRLVYRDVWWSHDSAGLRDPDLADLERRFADLPDLEPIAESADCSEELAG